MPAPSRPAAAPAGAPTTVPPGPAGAAPGGGLTMSGRDWGMLMILSLLWGGSFFFVQVAVPHLPPFTIVLARVGLGAAALGLVLWLSRTPLPRGAAVWRTLVVLGLLNNAVPFTLFVTAQGQISSGLAAILNATTPLFGAIVAHLFTRDERLTATRAAGVGIGFLGVVVMVGVGALQAGAGSALAQLACLGAALSYACSGVYGRRLRGMGIAPLSGAFGQVLSSSLMIAPLVVLLERPWTLAIPPLPVLGALAGLALLSTALAYLIYFRLLATAGAVNIMLVTLLIPVSAVLLGVAFLGEALAAKQVAGMALIALGLAVIDGRAPRALRARLAGRGRPTGGPGKAAADGLRRGGE